MTLQKTTKQRIRALFRSRVASAGAALALLTYTLSLGLPAYAISGLNSFNASPITEAAPASGLDTAQLHSCALRATTINNLLTRIANRGSKHLSLISDIANKTESYYNASGKSLGSYDALVNTVNTDKTAATSAVNLVRTLGTGFSCSGIDPLGSLQQFKDDTTGEVAALQTYKAAVQNLLTDVKSATAHGTSQ